MFLKYDPNGNLIGSLQWDYETKDDYPIKMILTQNDQDNYVFAALYGHLHILKWAKQNDSLILDPLICYNAAVFGYTEILEWTKKNNCLCGGYHHYSL